MAVVGEQGRGKSSLLRMVQEGLESAQSPCSVIPFSVWGYETTGAASTAILRAIIEKVGDHVGTVALSGLPEAYVSAVESSGGKLAKAMSPLLAHKEPKRLMVGLAADVVALC